MEKAMDQATIYQVINQQIMTHLCSSPPAIHSEQMNVGP